MSLQQKAYWAIHERLVTGEFAAGAVLSEPALAKQLGMSRTPVREALDQLALEGVVERVARYGTVVRRPDRRELEDTCNVRQHLEGLAAREAARRATPADLDLLGRLCRALRTIALGMRATGQRALTGQELVRFQLLDTAFHEALLRAAGNRALARIVAQLQLLTRVFALPRRAQDLRVVAWTYRHHRRVLRALKRHDAAAAERWMCWHLERSKKRLLEWHGEYAPHSRAAHGTAALAGAMAELNRLECEPSLAGEPAAEEAPALLVPGSP